MAPPIRIVHLITGLNTGGAEMTLLRLLGGMDRQAFDSLVICMIPIGPIGEKIQASGIPVISLEMPPGRPTLRGLIQMISFLRQFKPDIFQTWLYHADLLGFIAGKFTGVKNIIWNIRSSHMDFRQYGKSSGLVFKICAFLSAYPKAVVVNSQAGQNVHVQAGYRPKKWILIPNGIDTNQFQADADARIHLRGSWEVADDEILIGIVGRFDPMKDHPTFLKAAAITQAQHPKLCFVCIGNGPESYINEMKNLALQLGLSRVLWPGSFSNMSPVYNALDLLVSSSKFGEGFPNVVAEAMACEKPCVVTDVGDANMLVDNFGLCVRPGKPEDLAQAIGQMLEKSAAERTLLGKKARQRIVENYNMEKMSQAYSALYKKLA